MKYYLYVSDSKVDMLFPQVPHEIKKKVSMELGVDLKLLTVKRQTETQSEESRISRLHAVVEFIREFEDLGTPETPGDYVEHAGVVAWGRFREVLFLSARVGTTILGLGGSHKHLIGWSEYLESDSGFEKKLRSLVGHFGGPSTHYGMVLYLKSLFGEAVNPEDEYLREVQKGLSSTDIISLACHLTLEFGLRQRVEFLARNLTYEKGGVHLSRGHSHDLLFSTPLYIAAHLTTKPTEMFEVGEGDDAC